MKREKKPSLMEKLMAFKGQKAAVEQDEAQTELTKAQMMALQQRLPAELRMLMEQPDMQRRELQLKGKQVKEDSLMGALRRRMMPREVENSTINSTGNLANSMALSGIDPLQIRAMLASRLPQMVGPPSQEEFVQNDPVLRKLNELRNKTK
jgi:hypothetical protein